jgi:DNA polymerase III subunit beta
LKSQHDRKQLLKAFTMVSGVVPTKSPKPILMNVKLTVGEESTLQATDLEVGIRHRVLGVKIDGGGCVILPTGRFQSILATSRDDELDIETTNDVLKITDMHSKFSLPSEPSELFPEVPEFKASSYYIVAAADLKRLIKRTIFATDCESTRYAMGGCLIELFPESISMVATDGRRLAKMTAACDVEGAPKHQVILPVIPVKALKLIDRNLADDDPPVHIVIGDGNVMIRTEHAVIWSRLLEGRFPKYQDVFPSVAEVKIPLVVGQLLGAIEQASIVTSEESRGVDFTFESYVLRLASSSAEVGKSLIELPIDYQGLTVEITFDPRYIADALKTLDPDSTVTIDLIDAKNAAVLRTDDGYSYVVMPLTRDRS